MTSALADQSDSYVPVALATIHPSRVPDFPLYMLEDSDLPPRLYRDAAYPLKAEDIQRLVDRGVKSLYVAITDQDHYQQYLRDSFVENLEDETLPVAQRFQCLNEVVRHVLAAAFEGRNTDATVATARQLSAKTVELICREDMVARELLHVLHHDYHTFTHSANVSYFCVLLARAWGVSDRDELRQIATGALLHDIGKLDIPGQILMNSGCLDEDQWRVIRKHPTIGLRLLSDHADLNFGQLMMVYQHHERLDGMGYPVGITEKRIHPWAQLCAIVDVYEALSSSRPYRPALSQRDTIEILDRQVAGGLNGAMWECWKKIIQDV